MGQKSSRQQPSAQDALSSQCFQRKGSFFETLLAAAGLGSARLQRSDSNETLQLDSDESDDGSGCSDHGARSAARHGEKFFAEHLGKNRAASGALSVSSRRSSLASRDGLSRRYRNVSELLDVEKKEDEEDLELLSHLNTSSEYSDETAETYLTEDQELLLLRRAAEAWEKKDIAAITDCESEIRVKLLDPKKDSREDLENEVMLLRQQLESKNSEMLRLKCNSVSGVSASELFLIDSMSAVSDSFSESDAFSSVSGAGFL